MDYASIQQDLEEVPNGEVYFIFEKNDDEYCKIGKTIHSRKRPNQLQTGNRRKLYIYQTLKGYDRLETMLHKYFDEYRVEQTEWFNITLTDVDKIIKQYNELQTENEQILEDELEEKDNITDDITRIEETETTVITKKKVYKTKEEVHSCAKCGRNFTKLKYLQSHSKRTTPCDKKHKKCEKCGKKFLRQRDLDIHVKRITPCASKSLPINNEENLCHICGKTYASFYNLKRHQINCEVKNNPSLLMRLLEEKNQIISLQQQSIDTFYKNQAHKLENE